MESIIMSSKLSEDVKKPSSQASQKLANVFNKIFKNQNQNKQTGQSKQYRQQYYQQNKSKMKQTSKLYYQSHKSQLKNISKNQNTNIKLENEFKTISLQFDSKSNGKSDIQAYREQYYKINRQKFIERNKKYQAKTKYQNYLMRQISQESGIEEAKVIDETTEEKKEQNIFTNPLVEFINKTKQFCGNSTSQTEKVEA